MTSSMVEPYAAALRDAVDHINLRYQQTGIIVSGTIIRGAPHAASDLDFMVIHDATWRRRSQRFFNGVPAEIFVNPEFQMIRTIERESSEGRPVMSHLIATGEIVHDTDGVMARLLALAGRTLDGGPRLSADALLQHRHAIATGFEDAADIADIDPDRAHTIVTEALIETAKLHFLQQGRWLPRSKALLMDLDDMDPHLGAEFREALLATSLETQLALAAPLIDRIAGASGFFEWDGEPQEMAR